MCGRDLVRAAVVITASMLHQTSNCNLNTCAGHGFVCDDGYSVVMAMCDQCQAIASVKPVCIVCLFGVRHDFDISRW